jgi:hypothetical protein
MGSSNNESASSKHVRVLQFRDHCVALVEQAVQDFVALQGAKGMRVLYDLDVDGAEL